ncbi:DedA family protein [Pyxidicoccus fallax]|uniref:DedA family protein n=1 Tax=Pyxidicoccus fallax TaxID=394095 RepID=A0A848M0B8_9BACT|nr:DedA family protein [Pyxidicoccus fallax]NMO23212.1 DedA family protein [Pyxidicoccus fallax]NPC86082.1 DedA family protein [Pyxidicoccus fallax]
MSDGPLPWMLTHGSAAVLFLVLVAGGVGVPIPEDLVLLATGILSHRGVLPLPLALAMAFCGVLCGDLLLFLTARRLGPALYEHRRLRGLLPPERRERLARLYARHGGRLVFAGRFLSVLRGAVFAMAAVQGMPVRRFVLWDALALCVSVPVVVGLGYAFSHSVDRVTRGLGRVEHGVVITAVLGLVALVLARAVRARRAERGISPPPPRAAKPPRRRATP